MGSKFEIRGSDGVMKIVGLASDPSGSEGQIYYNSTDKNVKYHDGTSWVAM